MFTDDDVWRATEHWDLRVELRRYIVTTLAQAREMNAEWAELVYLELLDWSPPPLTPDRSDLGTRVLDEY